MSPAQPAVDALRTQPLGGPERLLHKLLSLLDECLIAPGHRYWFMDSDRHPKLMCRGEYVKGIDVAIGTAC